MPIFRHLRRCCPSPSHNANCSTITAYTHRTQPPVTQLLCCGEVRIPSQNLQPLQPAQPNISNNIIAALPTTLPDEMLLRRHRGGKVKNKLRNIEKRKKREQSIQKVSSDVKFN
ncbi:hypothetical protein X943_000709 [Babesia divergens]|uniref:Uncharacterized protein n=1 Tax=Babesia divergens TaxID=32595 RepID=A0AAD9GCL0_BABDI|nr:hypothetical protein X943_000709 [Babesia divergens]